MVKIQIEVSEEMNIYIMKDMYEHPKETKNSAGNFDKRLAVQRILKEYFETEKNFAYLEGNKRGEPKCTENVQSTEQSIGSETP